MTEARRSASATRPAPGAKPPRENPFRGLQPYTSADRKRLFGRDGDLLIVRDRIFAADTTVLMAAAGAGKTSFIDALLAPDLTERFKEHYDVAVHRTWSSADPWLEVREKIDAVRAASKNDASRGLILVLDQFEEVFQHKVASEAVRNVRRELRALLDANSRARVLFSMREDFLAQLCAFERDFPLLFRNYHRLQSPTEEQAMDIVEQTAAPTGVDAAGLSRLIEGLSSGEGGVVLPYLQISCRRLWAREAAAVPFTFLSAFAKVDEAKPVAPQAQVASILSEHLREQVAELSTAEQTLAARAVDFLVTSQGAKLPYEVKALATHMRASVGTLQSALEKLSTARVLKSMRRGDEFWFELYHDMYAPGLFEWRRDVDAEQARSRRNLIAICMGIALVLIFTAIVYSEKAAERRASEAAADAAKKAEERQKEARLSSLLTRAREREGQESPGDALLFRLAALREGAPEAERKQVARLVALMKRLVATVRMEGASPRAFFLADGKYFATVAELRSMQDGRLPSSLLNVSGTAGAGASEAGATNGMGPGLTLGADRSLVQLWDAGTGARVRDPFPAPSDVQQGELSPSGRYLVLSSASESMLWELGNDGARRREILRVPCSDGRFLSNGHLVLSCGEPRSLRVYRDFPANDDPVNIVRLVKNPAILRLRANQVVSVAEDIAKSDYNEVHLMDSATLAIKTRYLLEPKEQVAQIVVVGDTTWVLAKRDGTYRARIATFERTTGKRKASVDVTDCCSPWLVPNWKNGQVLLATASRDDLSARELNADGSSGSTFKIPRGYRNIVSPGRDSAWFSIEDTGQEAAWWDLSVVAPLTGTRSFLDASETRWLDTDGRTIRLLSRGPGDTQAGDGIAVEQVDVTNEAVAYVRENRVGYRDILRWADVKPAGYLFANEANLCDSGKRVAVRSIRDLVMWELGRQVVEQKGVLAGAFRWRVSPDCKTILKEGYFGPEGGGRPGFDAIDLTSGKSYPMGRLTFRAGDGPYWIWAPDSNHFVDLSAQKLFTRSSKEFTPLELQAPGRLAVFSPDGQWLIRGMINGTQVMRLADGTTRDIEFGPPASAAFSQDAKRIALVSEGRDLKVYEGTAQVASAPLRVTPRDVFFTPDATGVVVATDRWLHLYRIGSGLILLQSSRQLLGQWSGSYKFIDGDGSSLFVVTGTSEKYLRREEIHFTGVPSEAAIEGEPEKLIQEWSKKLGVTFSNDDILPDRVVSPVELSRPPVKPPPEPPGKPNPTEQTAPGGSAHG